MKLIGAFLKLIRWPNLVFIALTQLLFYYCIYQPLYHNPQYRLLTGLVVASVFIAAAGYIINDYFDLNIDQINKPRQNVFLRTVHRRWAIIWHFLLSFSGIVITAAVVGLAKWYLVLLNAASVGLLWFYSTSFKRQFLVGNIVISLLTAWTVLLLFFAFTSPHNAFMNRDPANLRFFRMAFLYAGFAFIISLIREAVKDMEDMEGDARYGCRTMPIVAGVRTTKIYAASWLVVLLAALVVLQLYMLQLGWWAAVIYSIAGVIVPAAILFRQLIRSGTKAEFGKLSSLSKWIMLTGILSMIFYRIYLI